MLDNVGLSFNLLKIFVQYRATLLAQQCCTMLASFEQALIILHALLNKVKNETTDHENKTGTLFEFVHGLLKHHIYTKYNQLFNLYY